MSKPRRPTEYWPTEHGVMTPDRARDTTSGPWYLKDEVKAERDDLRRENARLRDELETERRILSRADEALCIAVDLDDNTITDSEKDWIVAQIRGAHQDITNTLADIQTTEVKTQTCRWVQGNGYATSQWMWQSECEHSEEAPEYNPDHPNTWTYCPYCGKRIEIV